MELSGSVCAISSVSSTLWTNEASSAKNADAWAGDTSKYGMRLDEVLWGTQRKVALTLRTPKTFVTALSPFLSPSVIFLCSVKHTSLPRNISRRTFVKCAPSCYLPISISEITSKVQHRISAPSKSINRAFSITDIKLPLDLHHRTTAQSSSPSSNYRSIPIPKLPLVWMSVVPSSSKWCAVQLGGSQGPSV